VTRSLPGGSNTASSAYNVAKAAASPEEKYCTYFSLTLGMTSEAVFRPAITAELVKRIRQDDSGMHSIIERNTLFIIPPPSLKSLICPSWPSFRYSA
jgi:hypothetical protein